LRENPVLRNEIEFKVRESLGLPVEQPAIDATSGKPAKPASSPVQPVAK